MSAARTFVVYAGRVARDDAARRTNDNPLGVLVDAGLIIEGSVIRMVGPRAEVEKVAAGAPVLIDAPGAVMTPGLCDAHTHSVFTGSRHDEYVQRMAGASYEEIARAGGGIVASMLAVRAATPHELVAELENRLSRMAALGVTTVEVKSGYGLDADGERKQLEAIAQVSGNEALPAVVPTYLALHALPPEAKSSRGDYVAAAVTRVGEFAARGLMRFVDAYVDANAFTTAEAEAVAEAAKSNGVGVRLHAGQFADVGAAALAARLGASSADHLEHVTRRDLDALAAAGTRAVLLPVASFTLGQPPPPVDEIRAAGVRMVVASDANPGTAPTESLPLALAFAVRSYGLTPDEALLGATREAAHALGLAGRAGVLAAEFDANLVVWSLPHEHAIIQPWGAPKTRLVLRAGKTIAPATPASHV